MPKQILLTYLYFFLMIIDAFGVVFPDIIQRKYITFLPIPVLFILYLFSIKKVNWIYIAAIFFTFLGIIFFNTVSYFKIALIFYGIGVCLYVIISLKTAAVIPIKTIAIATIPFLIVYLVPLFFFYDAVQLDIFNYIMFYVFFVGLFFFIATLVYINQKNNTNLWLLCSGILFLISTTIHGYNLFFEYLTSIRVGIVITFLGMHFCMYKYVIKQ